MPATLHTTIELALASGECAVERLDPRVNRAHGAADRAATLGYLYGLLTGPLGDHTGVNRLATHPRLAELRWTLEQSWLAELEAIRVPAVGIKDVRGVVAALRALAARDRLPDVYQWVAQDADLAGLRWFLAAEGGPDGGFDDLVALCQVGLPGEAKRELARNYWDEMGRGSAEDVHTTLHDRMRRALRLAGPADGVIDLAENAADHAADNAVRRGDQRATAAAASTAASTAAPSAAALERAALGGLLATNHWLQPEMIGALGLIELQAGPRSRLVVQGMERLGLGPEATEFYRIHADVDPVHGRDWVDHAVRPLVAAHPRWGARIVRGAAWRSELNRRFFTELASGVQTRSHPTSQPESVASLR